MNTEITHRVIHDSVESDLVYPLDKGYNYVCQIDKELDDYILKM